MLLLCSPNELLEALAIELNDRDRAVQVFERLKAFEEPARTEVDKLIGLACTRVRARLNYQGDEMDRVAFKNVEDSYEKQYLRVFS